MKLSRTDKIKILEIAFCSSLGTSRWREYLPLSKKGYVEIDGKDSDVIRSMFGGSFRNVKTSPKGQALADEIMHDIDFWAQQAADHALNPQPHLRKADGTYKPCVCWACMAARRMAPRVRA